MNRKSVSVLISTVLFFYSATHVFAVKTPDFPSCANPTGTLIVSYESGIHGIVGSTAEYSGSDAVYQTSKTTLIQCFCPEEGSEGIQTNWWKFSGLTQSDINTLKNLGWFYIPSGAEWGLKSDPYLAKNEKYICRGGEEKTTPTPTPSATSTPAPTATITATPAPTVAPDVLGTTDKGGPSVLAATGGNSLLLASVLGAMGMQLLGYGLLKRKAAK
jgi:hypothetical protein